MRRWLLSLVVILLAAFTAVHAASPVQTTTLPTGDTPEQDQPWRLTLRPEGNLWAFQFGGLDHEVHWDYGATILMEIARGRGHAVWFGAEYRQAAGYGRSQIVTPFDPNQDDVAELIAWRYAVRPRFQLFTWLERWCFHEIDRHSRWATYYTHWDVGIGTISPAEKAMPAIRARKLGKIQLDGYLFAGPIISGNGVSELFGNVPSWKAIGNSYGVAVVPLTRTFQMEIVFRYDMMMLSESQPNRWRQRSDLRARLNIQRDEGGMSFFVGRHLRDQFPFRNSPVHNYIGLDYRF